MLWISPFKSVTLIAGNNRTWIWDYKIIIIKRDDEIEKADDADDDMQKI